MTTHFGPIIKNAQHFYTVEKWSTLKLSKEISPTTPTLSMGENNQFLLIKLNGGGLHSKRGQEKLESILEQQEILAIFFPKNTTSDPLRPMIYVLWPLIWLLEVKLHWEMSSEYFIWHQEGQKSKKTWGKVA